jgi:type III secretion protein V
MDIRRHLRKLIEGEFFELPVLSFQELSGDVPVVPLGQVRG